MIRIARNLTLSAGLGLASFACGGEPPVAAVHQPISVEAQPPGTEYFSATMVELIATGPAQIFYTIDGSEPSGNNAKLYTGPMEITSSTLVTFIALGDDEKWSAPGSELYTIVAPRERPNELLPRMLELSTDNIFFAARPGEAQAVEKSVFLRSIGPERVHISGLGLSSNSRGSSFYEDGIFSIEGPAAPFDLEPGKRVELKVRYRPTPSLRSAAIVIESDEMRRQGRQEVELWGRVINW